MRWISSTIAVVALYALAHPVANAQPVPNEDALLVVAHGARVEGWNERVIQLMEKVEWAGPKGVAFLTPRTPDQELASVADRLDKTKVKRIVIVPLLVSSFSDHYEEIRYYGRDRREVPDHYTHEPLKTRAELLVTPAMDSDRLLGRILADHVRTASKDPKNESVILVAHGPNEETDNEKWLACLRVQAAYLQSVHGFRRVEAATIRDDAPKPVKDAAVARRRSDRSATGLLRSREGARGIDGSLDSVRRLVPLFQEARLKLNGIGQHAGSESQRAVQPRVPMSGPRPLIWLGPQTPTIEQPRPQLSSQPLRGPGLRAIL